MHKINKFLIYFIFLLILFAGIGYSFLNQSLFIHNSIVVDATKLHKPNSYAYDVVKAQSLGSSSTINYNVSSQYAEENYTEADGYAHIAGVYQLEEDSKVYFYRGSVTNNNVLFANYCWKIVRTTTTGGVKLLYNGTATDGQCTNTTGESTTIGTSVYNSYYYNTKYVGYTYEDDDGNQTNSVIKTYIDVWYSTNMTSYTSYLEDTDYCNDRTIVSSYDVAYSNLYSEDGYTYYGSSARASYFTRNLKPSTICPQNSDKYTISSSNGNGLLTYPVGLLTGDEFVLAGATSYYTLSGNKDLSLYVTYPNTTYYLYINYCYWGMSPVQSNSTHVYISTEDRSDGGLVGFNAALSFGVRPVISLNSSVQFKGSGDGTSTSPYVVVSK